MVCNSYVKLLRQLILAQRANEKAKQHKNRNQSNYFYNKKIQHLFNACKKAKKSKVNFGWETTQDKIRHVIYFDLPTGQVSFHCAYRFDGPNYNRRWDGEKGVTNLRIQQALQACF